MKHTTISVVLAIAFWAMIALTTPISAQLVDPSGAVLTPEKEKIAKDWLDNLYEMGVEDRIDSFFISTEALHAATDTAFRRIVYPDVYTLPGAQRLLQAMYLKIATWHLINLYMLDPSSRKAVEHYITGYDTAVRMDRVLISAFYTYALFDPEIGTLKNGRPAIYHPEILEAKLNVVSQLTEKVLEARKARVKE
jgi:hypothetical protein